jgi:hypothetical protein
MDSTKHTPEPWGWNMHDMDGRTKWYIREHPWHHAGPVAQGGRAICKVSAVVGNTAARANASRIVACVNACAGIEDPASELARLRRVEAAARAAAD